ncbi:MAG TPA: hypothetical protein DEB20_09195 [Acidimicrobiaceae bacterium]|nr:hypothetical protein [Acidimicrobiaceae bacterium]
MAEAAIEPVERVDLATTGRKRSTTLDGVRALAALAVVVYHCSSASGFARSAHGSKSVFVAVVGNFGNFGVAVFFVLSGYLLFREFVRKILFDGERTPLPHYFERRFLRIYPAYWLALIGFVVVTGAPLVAGGAFGLLTLTERQFSNAVFPGIGVAWTLYVEVAFYVFMPFFAGFLWLLCRRRDVLIRVTIVLVALVGLVVFAHVWIGLIVPAVPPDMRIRFLLNLPTYFGWFAAGMALAVASVWSSSGRRLPKSITQLANRPVVCWSVGILAFLMVVLIQTNFGFRGRPDDETTLILQARMFLQGIAALFFVLPMAISARVTGLHAFVGSRPLAWIGVISYGIYLWHQIIIDELLEWMTFSPDFIGFLKMVAIVVPIASLFGWVSFRLIEKPALSLAK